MDAVTVSPKYHRTGRMAGTTLPRDGLSSERSSEIGVTNVNLRKKMKHLDSRV